MSRGHIDSTLTVVKKCTRGLTILTVIPHSHQGCREESTWVINSNDELIQIVASEYSILLIVMHSCCSSADLFFSTFSYPKACIFYHLSIIYSHLCAKSQNNITRFRGMKNVLRWCIMCAESVEYWSHWRSQFKHFCWLELSDKVYRCRASAGPFD